MNDPRVLLSDRRVLLLIGLVAIAIVLALVSGIKLGIEFEGGTRIPLTLEKPVDANVMAEIVNTIKTRVTKFGLSQVNIRGVGDTQIYVEVPKSDSKLVEEIEKLVREEGKFKGVVDGKVVLEGADVIPGSIQTNVGTPLGDTATWDVGFSINFDAAKKFSTLVRGKANKPVYMFLDKPENAVILVRSSDIVSGTTLTVQEALEITNKVLQEDNTTTYIYVIDNWQETKEKIAGLQGNVTNVVISGSVDSQVLEDLRKMNFTLDLKEDQDMKINYENFQTGIQLNSWPGIGLLSSPTLTESVTQGSVSTSYSISGSSRSSGSNDAVTEADKETRKLKSILSGGALPVKVVVGSTTTVPAPLGAEFLRYSIVGGIAVIVAIVLIISIRYRRIGLVLPILLISLADIIILVAVIGSQAQIDLSTMAGIIAAVGVSVDAQIVLTDELLKKEKIDQGAKKRFERGFFIVMITAIVAIVAMIPLFFSGIVEVVGFATSTILGSLLGVLISRPAYGAIVEKLYAN
ncbi:MMPL family transporter [Candidatus Micrarchaeota archaeon]|nr:MMPL family transporter [Candidatus Micrarchaeota archaeon]